MKNPSTILIVDDELLGRETLKALLIAHGYHLVFASSGAEALAQAAELVPDLILLDVMMPGMDGFEVCQRLRADPLLKDVPIAMVTALDDRRSRVQGIEAGADDFITKPFDPAELRARVRTTVRLNRYRRLLAERAKFEWVVETDSDGYVIVDRRGRVVYANAQARLYLGLPAPGSKPESADESEVIAETFPQLVKKQYRCEPRDAWAVGLGHSAASPPSPRYLVRPETPTGPAFWLQVDILSLPSAPDEGSIVRLRDVSKQVALMRDTWGFQEVIFHKLRTPLTGILVSMELLMKHASELSHAEIVGFSETAFRSAQRLHSDVEHILEYVNVPALAKPGAGLRVSQLQHMVAQISVSLGIERVGMSLQEDLGDVRLALSERAVELILWEVLENAKKFHPQQAPTVEILVSRSGAREITIQICDDGVELSPDQLAKIWIPYYQVEKSFTGNVLGMGLGLPMAATLVWGADGTCCVRNRQDGPGLVVELVLPRAKDVQGACGGN